MFSVHIRDSLQVVRGHYKSNTVGKVIQSYRKKFVVYIERIQRDKTNGTTAPVGIHPSKVSTKPTNQCPKRAPTSVQNNRPTSFPFFPLNSA